MAGECEEGILNWKSPMTLADLAIDLKELAEPGIVKIGYFHDCIGNEESTRINVGRYSRPECYDGSGVTWELHYVRYINQYSIEVKVCKIEADEPPPPPPLPPDEEIDYEWIEDTTRSIVNVARDAVLTGLVGLRGVIDGVKTGIETLIGELVSQISEGFSILEGAIGDLRTALIDDIGGRIDSARDAIGGLSDKIDGLAFPTLEGIKGAFLDVCADLAIALWDSILDKIEERYKETEEEAD